MREIGAAGAKFLSYVCCKPQIDVLEGFLSFDLKKSYPGAKKLPHQGKKALLPGGPPPQKPLIAASIPSCRPVKQ